MTIFVNHNDRKRYLIYNLVYNIKFADAGESRGLYAIELATGKERRLALGIDITEFFTPIATI